MAYGVCAALGGQIPDGGTEPLESNPKCVCLNPMAAMFCPYGHMLECHYPLMCSEAECEHYQREARAEGYFADGEPM